MRLKCSTGSIRFSKPAKNKLVEEVVIFNTDKKVFYPVSDGDVKIGDYALRIEYDSYGIYVISIKHTEE